MDFTNLRYLILSWLLVCSTANAARPTNDCAVLAKALPRRVWFPDNAQYSESVSAYWFKQARLLPACIVRPASVQEVSFVVSALSSSGTPFAIRGGGHATVIGASNVKDGVTIDMRSFNTVAFDKRTTVVSVGAGAVSDDVYQTLDPLNVTALGGRASTVGMAGFLTGGGLSFWAAKNGFACDSVVNFEVVLANGRVVNANANNYNDLFVALKGGANNFGVVTRFDLQTIPQGPFWGGGVVYPESTYGQQIAAFNAFKDPQRFDPKASIEPSFVYLGAANTYLSATSMFYSQPIPNASVLAPFVAIQPQLSNTLRISNTSAFAREVTSLSTPSQYTVWATTSFGIAPGTIGRIVDTWRASTKPMQAITNITSSMTFNQMPAAPRPGQSDSLGFAPGSAPEKRLVLMLITIFFDDANAYDAISTATKAFVDAVDQVTKKDGVKERYIYLNYAARWQHVFQSYGQDSFSAMKRTATKYDPRKVFQRQTGGIKLFTT